MSKNRYRPNRGRKIAVAAVLLLLAGCGTQIPAGYSGVKYIKFGEGTEMGHIYSEGFQWHMPWNTVYLYKSRLSENKVTLTVLSSDGATIQLDVSIWYRPIVAKLDSLQITIGPDYYNVVIAPALRGAAREIAGRFKPEEIYSSKREEMAKELLVELKNTMAGKYIDIEKVIFRNVTLPKRISDAINEKLAAEQAAERMKFILDRERQEAERKRIEAKGIADFQKIVSTGLNPLLLQWKGIEATEELAKSDNAKVVVIGNSKDGLPLILGGAK